MEKYLSVERSEGETSKRANIQQTRKVFHRDRDQNKNSARSRQFESFNIEHLRAPWVPAPAKSSNSNVASFEINKNLDASEYQIIQSSSSSIDEAIPVLRSQKNGRKTMSSFGHTHIQSQSSQNIKVVDPNPKVSTTNTKVQALLRNPSNSAIKQRKDAYQHHQRHIRKPSTQVKRVKHGHRRTGLQYTLKSKDSLIDVTACLQEKREEVMKLWEKSIVKGDPGLLSSIETANRLALEAAEEVEKLRRTIQDYQTKEDGLSDSDCVQLEQMRVNVLEKVKQFEEADNFLQENIARQSESKTSLVSAKSKTSQTDDHHEMIQDDVAIPPGRSESTTSVPPRPPPPSTIIQLNQTNNQAFDSHGFFVVKDAPSNFSEESECDNGTIFKGNKAYNNNDTAMTIQNRFSDKSTATALASLENLSRLNLIYEESISCPRRQEVITNINNGASAAAEVHYKTSAFSEQETSNFDQRSRHHPANTNRVRFTERQDEPSEHHRSRKTADDLYREKISSLQRHLMDTEHEVEELKSEIERIESDANFRVRILQNSVQDKFESLQVIPDYLQLVDQKLNETVQDKLKLQRDLDSKEDLISEMKEENSNLKRETEELREHLRKAENCKDFLSFKNTELEKNNTELRKHVEELTKQVAELTFQVKILQDNESRTAPLSHSRRDSSWESQKLQLQCAELKEQLSQSKKIVQSVRKSKSKLVSSLNERIEELMDALQHAQHHKHILGDQIRHLKKSYNELFPAEMFKPPPLPKKSSSKKNVSKSRQQPVEEPVIQPTVAWQTGNGIKLEDLLQVQLS